jgi:branched-subunit amino acid aminotransferase/4-amino-4-deoxychorismate lyase
MPLKSNDTDGAITRKRLENYVTAHEKVSVVALADANATLTATQVLESKLFTINPATDDRTLTTPTAAQILDGITDESVGTSFEFTIVNASPLKQVTLAAGSGVTVFGAAGIATSSSGTFVGIVTSTTAVSIYRK